jgi:hypothetical protein
LVPVLPTPAGGYGNSFAKVEAQRLNPYAQLCNQYLQQAMSAHWSGLKDKATATPEAGTQPAAESAVAANTDAATTTHV